MLTDEQIRVLLEMGDVTEEERQQLQQQLMANQLRRQVFQQDRMDYGSQASRALAGLFSGMAMNKANETGEGITDIYRDTLGRMFPQNEPGGLQTPGFGGALPPNPAARTMPEPALSGAAPSIADLGLRMRDPRTQPGNMPPVDGPVPPNRPQTMAYDPTADFSGEMAPLPGPQYDPEQAFRRTMLDDEEELINRLRRGGSY